MVVEASYIPPWKASTLPLRSGHKTPASPILNIPGWCSVDCSLLEPCSLPDLISGPCSQTLEFAQAEFNVSGRISVFWTTGKWRWPCVVQKRLLWKVAFPVAVFRCEHYWTILLQLSAATEILVHIHIWVKPSLISLRMPVKEAGQNCVDRFLPSKVWWESWWNQALVSPQESPVSTNTLKGDCRRNVSDLAPPGASSS